ncbi:MAG: 3-dehydroquinate synthase [Muribaculaceae bacterium]|nr:3-dehydroquinate synthase [Muribaculaceae bacterium]
MSEVTTHIYYCDNPAHAIEDALASAGAPQLFVVADDNTARMCLPLLAAAVPSVAAATVLTLRPGDEAKTLSAAESLWRQLTDAGATRKSMILNLGGGMVTDLGGFVAATFKRGMPYINVPTTLLGTVDAAVGGKTAVNFAGLKNQVGVFAQPAATFISTCFFDTLPERELLSGYAEMLKHALLEGPEALAAALDCDIIALDPATLLPLLRESVATKERIVAADPTERGLRKALNLGHTAGHAIEELALEKGALVPHGYAVAWGLVVELVLSHTECGMSTQWLYPVAACVRRLYGSMPVECSDYPRLLALMAHDKKNTSPDTTNFTLLEAPGRPRIDCTAAPEAITAALDIARDLI